MIVTGPPRLQGTPDLGGRAKVAALREQALIEEARRRARRRRSGYAGVAILTVAVVVAIGFAHGGGVDSGTSGRHAARMLSSTAIEGRIAVADGSGTLRVVNPDGTGLRSIAHCSAAHAHCGIFEPAWAPDGTKLAYVRGQLVGPFRSTVLLSLYVTDVRSGVVRRLASCGNCGLVNRGRLGWSPDGSRIAFTRDTGRGRQQTLWIIDSTGRELRRLTSCASTVCIDVQPTWAPNGRLIVFSRIGEQGSSLYTLRADGSGMAKTSTVPGAVDPSWSPDGSRIAFDTGDDIYVADLRRAQSKLLVSGNGAGSGPGVPSWSPDGTRIAFFNTPAQSGAFIAEVWTIRADGSARQRLARTGCCVESWAAPVWSPDSKEIAFAANSAGGTFAVNSDGGALHRLTSATAVAIAWRPGS